MYENPYSENQKPEEEKPEVEVELNEMPAQASDAPAESPTETPPIGTEQSTQPAQPEEITQDSRNLGMLCHLLGLFTGFLGPLILWVIKKDEDSYVDQQGKEALNFQIMIMICWFVSVPLSFVCIGVILAIATGITNLVCSIMACIAASKGEDYRYPFSIRLVK